MKASVNWLRELCPTELSTDELARRLTAVGLEIEGREERGLPPQAPAPDAPAGVVVAKVLAKVPVAGSDHLNLCDVDDGSRVWKVVCGAQNYVVGDLVPLARIGAVLPGGLAIRQAKLRGVESFGMLCSARELGLSDDHAGLLVLPKEAPVGAPIERLLGLPDTVFEVNVTPNRPDCLSHLGVARELAALLGTPLRPPGTGLSPAEASAQAVHAAARVEIAAPDRCGRYTARVIEGVKIGPSPLAIQERLRGCGVRALSNVVDATNLALLELGHPLHAFDLDTLRGARIVVRRAAEGEPLTTLDGKARSFTADDLFICDGEGPVALAGIMGGQRSEVSDGTTRILLESAWFEPSGIRRTSKRQGLKSEASLRFEKGADEEGARAALDRCAELIVQLAGGRILPGVIDVHPAPQPKARVTVRPARVRSVLGAEIAASEVEARLSSLGLRPVAGAEGGTSVARVWEIPSWRRDLTREIDCIEEVARQRGLDTIPIVQHAAGVGETQARSIESQAIGALRAQLSARGFHEAVNYSFVAEMDLDALVPAAAGAPAVQTGTRPIRVANPLTIEQGAMRTTLVAGLLRNLSSNLTRGAANPRLYELGRVYLPGRDPRRGEGRLAWPAHEPVRIGLASAGASAPGFWGDAKGQPPSLPAEEREFFELKGALEDLVRAAGGSGLVCRVPTEGEAPHLHPAASAVVTLDGLPIGSFGKVHPLVARHYDLPPQAVVAELELAPLLAKARRASQSRGLPRFPSVGRDLAFVVRTGVPADALLAAIRGADGKGLLESVSLFDLYRGAQVPAGQKSLAFQLVLRAADRTLTDAEADGVVSAVVDRLRTEFQAEIRA